jgi:hypothetical protein
MFTQILTIMLDQVEGVEDRSSSSLPSGGLVPSSGKKRIVRRGRADQCGAAVPCPPVHVAGTINRVAIADHLSALENLQGPRRGLGLSFEVAAWNFGNSVRRHEAHSICGSVNNDTFAPDGEQSPTAANLRAAYIIHNYLGFLRYILLSNFHGSLRRV